MPAQFTTIGHSNRSLDEVVGMLTDAGVGLLVDVRAFPRSRTNPQFNIDTLPDDLARAGIDYRHRPDLGGRRTVQHDVNDALNATWRNRSFHNYADYALGDEFGAAFDALTRWGEAQRVCLMCSEAVWWRCHRRIIVDYLLLNGHPVDHLMGPGQIVPAKPTPAARRTEAGTVIYPPEDAAQDVVQDGAQDAAP